MIRNLFFSNGINLAFNLTNFVLLVVGLILLGIAFYKWFKNSREIKQFKKLFTVNVSSLSKEQIGQWLGQHKPDKKGILYRSLSTLDELSKSTLEDRDKILYMEDIRNDIRIAIPKVVPSLAVFIGFLGTVLGLFLAISAMPEIFNDPDFGGSDQSLDVLVNSMVSAMDGMSIAFGTTLVGLSVSLILTIGNLFYSIFWRGLDYDLHHLLNVKLFPIYNKPDDDNIVKALTEAVEESKNTMKLIEFSNRKLIEGVQDLSRSMTRYNEKTERLVMQVFRAVEQFSESQKGNKDVFKAIQKLALEASNSYAKVEKLLNTAQQDRDAFLAYLQDSRNEIKEVSTLQHQAYEKTNQDFLAKQEASNQHFLAKQEVSNEEFLTQQKQNTDYILNTQKTLYKNQIDYFTNEQTKYQEVFEEMRNELLKNVKTEYQTKLKEFTEHSESLCKNIKEIADNTTSSISKQVVKTNKSVRENVTQLKKTVDEFGKKVAQNNQQYEKDTKGLIQTLSALVMKNIEANKLYID